MMLEEFDGLTESRELVMKEADASDMNTASLNFVWIQISSVYNNCIWQRLIT